MKLAKEPAKVRMSQRSDVVAGNEANGLKPIAAAQNKNRTMHPSDIKKSKVRTRKI
jgi:hypothetical protein